MTDIFKFTGRKDRKQFLKVKKDLKDLSREGLDLPSGTKIFHGPRISDYIVRVKLSWIKITYNDSPLSVTYLDNFKVNFSDIDLSPPTEASS